MAAPDMALIGSYQLYGVVESIGCAAHPTTFPTTFIVYCSFQAQRVSTISFLYVFSLFVTLCVVRCPLCACVRMCSKVRFSGRRCDSLLLSFADAKVSIVDFDVARQDLATSGMYTLDHKLRMVFCDSTYRMLCVFLIVRVIVGVLGPGLRVI